MTTPSGSTPQPEQSGPYGQPQPGQPGQYGQPTPANQPGQYGQPTPANQPGQPAQPAQYGQPTQYGAPGQPPGGAAGARSFRPGQVTAAAVLAWIGSAFMIIIGLLLLFAQAIDPAELGVPGGEEMLQFLTTMGLIVLVWGLLVLAITVFAFRRASWARWVLVVVGALAVIGSLVNLVQGNALALVSIAWVGASVGLLLSPQARQWYRARTSGPSYPGHYAG